MLNVAGYCSASCGPILNIFLLGGGEDPYMKINLYQILCQPNQIWYRLYFLLNSLPDESISDSISRPRHLAAWVKIKIRCAAPLCWKRNILQTPVSKVYFLRWYLYTSEGPSINDVTLIFHIFWPPIPLHGFREAPVGQGTPCYKKTNYITLLYDACRF